MIKIKNQAKGSAEIYIYGDIIDDDEGGFISEWWDNTDGYEWPKAIKEQLDAVKGKDLTVYINSYGGRISAGVAMANMIKRHEGKTTAIIDGFCCSIATQIFFAADVCRMPTNAYLMIHKPWQEVAGDANELRKAAETLDILQDGLETAYRAKALEGVADEFIHNMVESETWLTGTDAGKIFNIEVLPAVKAAACYGSMDKLRSLNFRRIPKGLQLEKQAPVSKDDSEAARAKVKIALARMKGVMVL